MSIANSCRTQWVLKIIQEKQVQYTDIIDLFQVQNVSKLYIQCNFFTDLGSKDSTTLTGGNLRTRLQFAHVFA
jgi:hypothetical protein